MDSLYYFVALGVAYKGWVPPWFPAAREVVGGVSVPPQILLLVALELMFL